MRPAIRGVAETYRLLGRRPPSLWWAKAELFLGLGAAACGCGLLRTGWAATTSSRAVLRYPRRYGHRSHLYDAMTRQTTLLRRR